MGLKIKKKSEIIQEREEAKAKLRAKEELQARLNNAPADVDMLGDTLVYLMEEIDLLKSKLEDDKDD